MFLEVIFALLATTSPFLKAPLKTVKFKIKSRHNNRVILADVFASPDFKFQPIIVFAHGLNGFKDWGPFPAMAAAFADAGFAFCTFNFSHNGTTPDTPTEFTDLEGYKLNTIGIELSDLEDVLEFFTGGKSASEGILVDKRRVGLMGHSWGGSVAILEAARNPDVKALATLAAQAEFGPKWDTELRKNWASDGYRLLKNSRTKQELPMGYGLLLEVEENPETFNPLRVCRQIRKPWLIVHGDDDETVTLADGLSFKNEHPGAHTLFIPHTGHTFGEHHPFLGQFSPAFEKVVTATIRFFQKTL
jgi:pimeloyl-ACP methyl ester carboxylesterase